MFFPHTSIPWTLSMQSVSITCAYHEYDWIVHLDLVNMAVPTCSCPHTCQCSSRPWSLPFREKNHPQGPLQMMLHVFFWSLIVGTSTIKDTYVTHACELDTAWGYFPVSSGQNLFNLFSVELPHLDLTGVREGQSSLALYMPVSFSALSIAWWPLLPRWNCSHHTPYHYLDLFLNSLVLWICGRGMFVCFLLLNF